MYLLFSNCTHKATGDPYYLEAGRTILDNLNRFARVPCGFAAMKDVRTGSHEDRFAFWLFFFFFNPINNGVKAF